MSHLIYAVCKSSYFLSLVLKQLIATLYSERRVIEWLEALGYDAEYRDVESPLAI